jgi:hypothetical protein
MKEFTTGDVHDITDSVFVVRRAFSHQRHSSNRASQGAQVDVGNVVDGSSSIVQWTSVASCPPGVRPFYSDAAWYRTSRLLRIERSR